jgi:hypothetical protein
MPPKGYSNLSVRVEVKRELERLGEELGFSSLNDVIVMLIKTYRDYANAISKIERFLAGISNTVRTTQEGQCYHYCG